MHISMVLDLDPEACMHVWFLNLMYVCMCDAYVLDPDTCDHDVHTYYAFIHDPWSWYVHVWCIYQCYSILDSDACVYDAHIYGTGPWFWSMHVCMILDVCMHVRCIFSWSWYMWPWYIYLLCIYPWPLILIQVCMMHPECICPDIYGIYDIYDACVNDAHICDPGPWSWSSHLCMILDPDVCMYDAYSLDPDIRDYDAHFMMHLYMHVWCIYQFSLILDSDACVYDAHIYAGPWFWSKHVCIVHESMMRYFLVTNGRTDERTRRF